MLNPTNNLRKIILEYLSNDIVKLNTYYVVFHTPNSSDIILVTHDLKDAKYEFDNFNYSNIPDNLKDGAGMSIVLSKKTNKYRFIFDDDMGDYPIEDYGDDSDIYEFIGEEDFDDIEHKEIKPINYDSDILLSKVETYFKEKYGNYKYNIISVLDDEENTIGTIKLRISDHSENIHNIDRYGRNDYHISVVISNFDKTEKRFGFSNAMERRRNEFELNFTSEDEFENIIYDIEEKIDDCREEII